MQKTPSTYDQFRQVFFEYYKPLCQYALTLLKEPNDAEDIVQEVLLRVWEKRQDLLDKKEIKFYLFAAVHNNCLTSLEKKKKSVTVAYTGQERIGEQQMVAENLVAPDLGSLVEEALDRLPPKCREVFVLSRISKLTYQQIADVSGISVKTVENQVGKALRIMRAFLKEKQAPVVLSILFFSLLAVIQ